MRYNDITAAMEVHDWPTLRRAFCALAVYPDAGEIESGGPGFLALALPAVCNRLAGDGDAMPTVICTALGLPDGATFAQGTGIALSRKAELAQRYKLHAGPRHGRAS